MATGRFSHVRGVRRGAARRQPSPETRMFVVENLDRRPSLSALVLHEMIDHRFSWRPHIDPTPAGLGTPLVPALRQNIFCIATETNYSNPPIRLSLPPSPSPMPPSTLHPMQKTNISSRHVSPFSPTGDGKSFS